MTASRTEALATRNVRAADRAAARVRIASSIAFSALSVASILLIWEAASRAFGLVVLFPPPTVTLRRFVELLANSDNVLRCGLTPKHIDVPELVRITDFNPLAEPRRAPTTESADRVYFRLPVPDFELSVCRAAAELPADRPWLVLAGEQPVTLAEPAATVSLAPWHAAFVPAGSPACRAEPSSRMFLASVAAE